MNQQLGPIVARGVKSSVERHAQILANLARNLPQFKPAPAHGRRLDVCGFAPSIKDTWHEAIGDVLTISGSHGLMLSKGVIPKFHLEVDPRDDKTPYITPPHSDVEYLLASVCHPKMFECVEGFKCTQWHSFNNSEDVDFAADNLPSGTELIVAGSTAGLFALVVGYKMGYRDIHVHGMDSSNANAEQRHAGAHFGKPQKPVEIQIGQTGPKFITSLQMVSQAREFFHICGRMPDAKFTVHGHGLLQSMVPEEQKITGYPNIQLHRIAEAA